MAKVKVTNPKYDKNIKAGSIITIPDALLSQFLKYGYGEEVKRKPKKAPQNKAETAPKNKA